MSTVREPRSEAADPFGDLPLFPPPASDTRLDEPILPPAPHDPPVGGGFGEIVANVASYGIAKLIVVGVIFAISSFGWRVFGGLDNDGPPNVPIHITTACETAFAEGLGAGSMGTVVTYEQSGSNAVITFETVTGEALVCTYNSTTGDAAIG